MKIAFGCNARVGKNTAASYLASKHGGTILSFAGAIYDIMHYTQRICNFEETKDREFLRLVGMWARSKNEDTWVNIVANKIGEGNYFISDLRFPNEYKKLKELGFLLVKIERDGDAEVRKHESETALIGYEWDVVIDNNGTLEEFYKQLDALKA